MLSTSLYLLFIPGINHVQIREWILSRFVYPIEMLAFTRNTDPCKALFDNLPEIVTGYSVSTAGMSEAVF